MPAQRRPLLKNAAELITVAAAGLILVASVATGTGIVGKGGSDNVTQTSGSTATSPGVRPTGQYVSGLSSARGSVDPWTSGDGTRRTSPRSTIATTGSREEFVDTLGPWLSVTPPPARGSQPAVIPVPTTAGTTTGGSGTPAAAPTSPAGSQAGGGSTGTTPPETATPTPSGSGTPSPSAPPSSPSPTPTTPTTSPSTTPPSTDSPSTSSPPQDTPSGPTETGVPSSSGTSDAQTGTTGGSQSGPTATSTPSGAPLAQSD